MRPLRPVHLLAILLTISESFAQNAVWPSVYERISQSVVKIEGSYGGYGSFGAGFIVSSEGWVVTNRHVVEEYLESNVRVKFKDKRSAAVRKVILSRDDNVDLALVLIDMSNTRPVPILAYEDARIGENVMVIGHPKGEDWAQFTGTISRVGAGEVSKATDVLMVITRITPAQL